MTRVNLIEPVDLLDQHLMAEYRELPMVGASLGRTLASINGYDKTKVPRRYTTGKGHVYFFYNKVDFLTKRYEAIVTELKQRGYNLDVDRQNDGWKNFYEIEDDQISYAPTEEEIKTNIARLHIRYLNKPDWYKYKGELMENYAVFLSDKYLSN